MLLVIVIISVLLPFSCVPSWAYYDEEADSLAKIRALRQSKAPTARDGTPTNISLAEELWRLSGIYLRRHRLKDCDQATTEVLSILAADQSQLGVSKYGHYSAFAASFYTEQGEFARAKECIDTALRIAAQTKADPKDPDDILHPALSSLLAWQMRQRQWQQAEATILQIKKLDSKGFHPHTCADTQEKLIEVYLQTNQLSKAESLITTAEHTTMPNSEGMFYRVRLLRAQGKSAEADKLEDQVRLRRKQEEENREHARL